MSTATGITTIKGKIYDENVAVVDGATVRVRALRGTDKFDVSVQANGGAYVVNGVPTGVQVQVVASKTNWTSRSRVETFLPAQATNQESVINFGGPSDSKDPEGSAYFVSDFPEIISANPDVKSLSERTGLTYAITFSEPLDELNRNRAAEALRISSSAPTVPVLTIALGASFLGDREPVEVTWDTEGKVMTLKLNAPLYSGEKDDTPYTVRLIRKAGAELIVDGQGHVLGMEAPPADGGFYRKAFLMRKLALTNEADAMARFSATHTSGTSFEVPKDDRGPVLASVKASDVTINGVVMKRFSLTFDEAMQVFPSIYAPSLTLLDNYIFALSSKSDISGMDMERGPIGSVGDSGAAKSATGAVSTFVFTLGTVEPSVSDPKVVWVTVPKDLVPLDARSFNVRVRNVQDPTGNLISTNINKDLGKADNVKSGSL